MMRQGLLALTVCGAVLLAAGSARGGGRPGKEGESWFGHVALGYSFASGDFGDIVDDDVYLNGGATYWPDHWPVGINLDLAYTEYDVEDSVIQALNDQLAGMMLGEIAGAEVETFALTGNALWGPDTSGKVGFYLLGGVGVDYIEGRVTDNGLVYYPPVCDPWWWWCYPGGVGPGTFVVASKDSFEFSYNVGVGLTFELFSGSQIFLEAKYHNAGTDRADTEYLPVVIGFRW